MKRTIIRASLLLLFALSPLSLNFTLSYLPPYAENSTTYQLLFILPYILLLIGAYLGLRLNQTRIFFSMILFTLLYFFLYRLGNGWLEPGNQVTFIQATAVMAPLSVLLLFSFGEGALFGLAGLYRAAVIFIFFVSCYLLAHSAVAFIQILLNGQFLLPFESWKLPDLLWLPLALTVVVFAASMTDQLLPFKLALLASLITVVITLNKTILVQETGGVLRIFHATAFSVIGLLCLHALYKLYWQKVYIDELTGIPNRRAFDEKLRRLGRKYSIAMVDIDFFKKFNDTYGHTEGDNVLRYVATHLDTTCGGQVYRYGGEEFTIIYPGSHIKDIFWRVDHMRESLAGNPFHIRVGETIRRQRSAKDRGKKSNGTKKVKVTISAGVAQRSDRYRLTQEVVDAADRSLYLAKKKGRNCCVRTRK